MLGCSRRTLVGCAAALALACRRRSIPPLAAGSHGPRRAVFAEIVARQIERRLGAHVTPQPDLGGGLAAHEALLTGRVDIIIECTGFALTSILKRPAEPRPEVVLERVRLEYASQFRLRWLDPLGFEDGFVLVVSAEAATRHRVARLSDAAGFEPGWELAAPGEFLTRPDGMAALMRGYPLRLRGGPFTMTPSDAYQALREGKVTMVAARAADGELLADDLLVLKDDRHALPPNQAALVVREEALARYPGLEQALAELSGRIAQQQARSLNAEAARRPPAAVAGEFLREAVP